MAAPIIHLEHVGRIFHTKTGSVEAIGDVSLDVAENEFVSVLGPSGCGKSTLLRIVSGLIPATRGTVLVKGEAVTSPMSDIGIVFQTSVLLPWLSILDNVLLPVAMRRLRKSTHRDSAMRLLDLVGLKGFEGSYPYQLSGGMQQRASLCRALLLDPVLLLMDEPFGALDAMTREQMTLELQRVWMSSKKTVLFITHSIAEAVFLSDRVVVLSDRPSKVREVVSVKLERPREFSTMESPAFTHLVGHVRSLMSSSASGTCRGD